MNNSLRNHTVISLHRMLLSIALAGLGAPLACVAAPGDEPFYQQLMKSRAPEGYSPTRSFTIINDPEDGNQLVAEDDPDLQFNVLWMEQFQPGYKSRRGGSAFGQILRGYLKSAYKSYRERHQSFTLLPDENGSVKVRSFSNEVDYRLNWNGDDVKLGVRYSF